MATTKKTGIVDKVKDAIAGFFSAERKPAMRASDAKEATATPKAAKKGTTGPKKATSKAAKKAATVAKKAPAKKAAAKKSSMDRKLIALTEPYEVRDWCKSLACSEAELKAAVAAVGSSAEKVRAHLKAKAGRSKDRKLIALSQLHEVRDWCESLGCDEATLKAAVAAVGPSAVKVRAHLRK